MKLSALNRSTQSESATFWIPVSIFCLIWTVAPLIFLPNYWLDIIEQLFVGKEWVLSTGKHPALTATILHIFWTLTGKAPFAPYLLSQLMMGSVLWVVWKTAREYLPPTVALLPVFLLFNYYWMSFGSADYNNNVTLVFAWGWSFFLALKALKTDRIGWWLGLGVAVGIGLNLKYTEIFFPVAFFLFLTMDREGRPRLKSWKLWSAAGVAAILFLPQTLWIFHGHWRTIEYALMLDGEVNPPIYHLLCPLDFVFQQTLYWIIFLILLFPLLRGPLKNRESFHLRGTSLNFDEKFLLAMTFLPFLFQVLYAALSAQHIRLSLGCHLWIYVPVLLLRFLPIRRDSKSIGQTQIASILLAVLVLLSSVMVTIAYPYVTGRCSRYLFPGRELAREVEKAWNERSERPIPWVTGEWWLAGNVAVYGKDHPRVHYSRGPDTFCGPWQATTWGTYDDIRREGGVLLWEIRQGDPPRPSRLDDLFPTALSCPEIRLRGKTSAPIPEFRFGMAVIPPAVPAADCPSQNEPPD